MILGVKLTHDAGVAVLDGDELLYAVELEKTVNSPRYAVAESWAQIGNALRLGGYSMEQFSTVAIDGWRFGRTSGGAVGVPFQLAGYTEEDVPAELHLKGYTSHPHTRGHVLGTYMTAPFAGEPAYVLVMDGGIAARLYYVDPTSGVTLIAPALTKLGGALYGIMGLYAGPFKCTTAVAGRHFAGMDVPGKLMSWIAHGSPQEWVMHAASVIHAELPEHYGTQPFRKADGAVEHAFMSDLTRACKGVSDEDLLASVHQFMCRLLLDAVREHVPAGSNLCFTGGSALNIKWNSALRSEGYSVWVPPFPNDSGSAIGAAACEAWAAGHRELRWRVYCGPRLTKSKPPEGWRSKGPCYPADLVQLMMRGELITFLYGSAEIGPRALGHRSVLADARVAQSASKLNKAKGREPWRPVAPVVLEEDAPTYFTPGTPDPYMLFDHQVKPAWREALPAIVHMDGTARLQTVGVKDGSMALRLLLQMANSLMGVGVLCNTSANFNGKGFFPDAASAMLWGGTNYVCADFELFAREGAE